MEFIKEKILRRGAHKNPFKDNLETDREYKERWYSIYVIYFTTFLMSLGFSIVVTGVWPYLDKLDPTAGKPFMGYVVGANPFGQMLFSPVLGWWSNKRGSIRMPLLVTLTVFGIASSIYSSLELFSSHRKYWMLASRFLVGISSGNVAAGSSYVSAATRISERRKAISMMSLSQVLGFVVGPAVQAAVVPFGNDGFWLIEGRLKLNMYTMAGWINVILAVVNFCMFLFVFKEHKIAAREAMVHQGAKTERETWKSVKIDKVTVLSLIFLNFVLVFNFMIMETLGTSVVMDEFAWAKGEAIYFMGILLSVGAIITCTCFIIINPLCKRFSEPQVMIWGGFFLMALGRLCYLPWGSEPPKTISTAEKTEILVLMEQCKQAINITDLNCANVTEPVGCPLTQSWCATENRMVVPQFVLGSLIGTLGFPVGLTLLQTIFSKLLGSRPQGTWMGIMQGSGSLSRVLGPVLMMQIYTSFGPTWTFGVTTVMLTCSVAWLYNIQEKLIIIPAKPVATDAKEEEMDVLNKTPDKVDDNISEKEKSDIV